MLYIWITTSVLIPIAIALIAYMVAASYRHDAHVARMETQDANDRAFHMYKQLEDVRRELVTEKSHTRKAENDIDRLNNEIARAMAAHKVMEDDQAHLAKEIDRLAAMAEPDDVSPPPNIHYPVRSIDIA